MSHVLPDSARKLSCCTWLCYACAGIMAWLSTPGMSFLPAQTPPSLKPPREIFLPLEDLSIILEAETQRVFLTRKEYEELLASAKLKVERQAPLHHVLKAANYTATLEPGRAVVKGTITFDVLKDELQLIPLKFSQLGVRSATLDNQPAPLARDAQLGIVLPVQGRGSHTLQLELTTPLITSAAQQTLQMELPHAPASTLALSVPGNVEVKSGAAVISRRVDEAQNLTHLDLAMKPGPLAMVLSLNNKQQAKNRIVISRGVMIAEVTAAYERLHGTVSLVVLHGAMEEAKLTLPEGFEVTSVDSPVVSRWEVKQKTLVVSFREPATETVTLNISAARHGPPRENWHFPRLSPVDVESQAFVLGLVLEDRWQASDVIAKGLIPLDTLALTNAMPPSVLEPGPGLPSIRPMVAYYAPHALYDLQANFSKPSAELLVTTSVFLTVKNAQHTAEIGLALQPRGEPNFTSELLAPAGWLVQEVKQSNGSTLPFERYPQPDGSTRVLLTFPQGLPPNVVTQLSVKATSVPKGWLGTWTEQSFVFPSFVIVGAQRNEGAIALAAEDDLELRPDKITGLLPLTTTERQRYELGNSEASLAYRYEGKLSEATFLATRKAPSSTAEVYSFFKIKLGALAAHHELAYDIREAATRELLFTLPADTPTEISIRGLDASMVKETTSSVSEKVRTWRVVLAERQRGLVKLAVDWEKRLESEEQAGLELPLLKPVQVEFHSGFVAVEGDAELETVVRRHPRKVDEGELFAAEYQVGPRLVGAFGYLEDTSVTVDVSRHAKHVLPTAITQRADLLTQLSVAGKSQTEASYVLTTKAPFLEMELPPQAELWTITFDGRPTKPQRHEKRLLLSLPGGAEQQHTVNIVYQQQSGAMLWASSVSLSAPRLLVRDTPESEAVEVPTADAAWTLLLPSGFELRRNQGSLDTTFPTRPPAAIQFLRWLGWFDSGVQQTCAMGVADPQAAVMTKSFTAESASSPAFPPAGAKFMTESLDEAKEASETAPAEEQSIRMRLPDLKKEIAETTPRPTESKPADAPQAEPVVEAPKPAAMPLEEKIINAEKDLHDYRLQTDKLSRDVAAERALRSGLVQAQQRRLEGVSGLLIGVQREPNSTAFTLTSLGDSPAIEGFIVRREPFLLAALAIGSLIFAWGLLQLRSAVPQRIGFVMGVLLTATLLPLAIPMLASDLGELFDGAFFGAALVGIIYLVVAWWQEVATCSDACRRRSLRWIAWFLGNTATLVLCMLQASEAYAQPPANTPPATQQVKPLSIDALLPLLVAELQPVKIPADAVLVPYDPADPQGVQNAEKVLVPYAKYFQLWNIAHPEKKLAGPEPAISFGISTAQYSAALQSNESWEVRGEMEIEVWSEKPVTVPLGFLGGVLAQAEVDGQAARLQIITPQPVQQPMAQAAVPLSDPLMLLHLQGKGRKKFSFVYRLPWNRQGSWRVASGALPTIGGAGFKITPPAEPAEIRLNGFADRNAFDTSAAKDLLHTSLDLSGKFTLSWRPKVAEAMIDRGLAVNSQALFDVRQDVLRLTWLGEIAFPRSRRDRLTFQVPKEFLVERVSGPNIRAWEATELGGVRQIEVTLLKEAIDRESLSLALARYGTVGQGEMEIFRVPLVTVPGAELQQGKVVLRRDELLEVRISETQGLTREDADLPAALAQAAEAYDSSLLPVKVFQAYRFVGLPVTIRLSAAPAEAVTEADTQLIVNLGERNTSLEASVVIKPRNTPVHRVDVLLPQELSDFEVEVPVAGGFEKSVSTKEGRPQLTVLLRQGQTSDFPVLITGKLAPRDGEGKLSIPKFAVLGVTRQQGTLVVQADPAYEVRMENLEGCESIPLGTTFGWLQEQKRTNARSALRWHSENFAATLRAVAKQPLLATELLHNVKITTRSVEQTILARFHVSEAGVREVSLLLPEALKSARVTARNVRRSVIESAGANVPQGFVRLRVELEDEFLGHYQLLLVHDRLLTTVAQTIQLPVLDSGTGRRRLLMVESAGRDEVLVDATTSLEPLARGQQAFTELTNALSAEPTQAYLAKTEVMDASLTFSLKQREAVATAAARIGLAETLLLLDRSGAYRVRQEYRVDNSSEQYLEVVLPEDSVLWTVTVDSQPAKPVQGKQGTLRIPIIRRARGDADYKVVLIYAGRMPKLAWHNQVRFPFSRTVNIHVERSVVRLMLPESFRWFGFDGSLGQPVNEADVQKTAQDYLRRQLDISRESISSGNKYEVARAQNNLKQIGLDLLGFNSANAYHYSNDHDLNQRFLDNGRVLQEELAQANEELELSGDQQRVDNRERFNSLFDEQELQRAKNVVSNETRNFGVNAANPTPLSSTSGKRGLNSEWFENNKLNPTKPQLQMQQKITPGTKSQSRFAVDPTSQSEASPAGEPRIQQGQSFAQQPSFKRSGDANEAQQQALQDRGGKYGKQQADAEQLQEQAVNRYRSKLAQQNPAQVQTGPSGGGLGGGRPPMNAPADPQAAAQGKLEKNVQELQELQKSARRETEQAPAKQEMEFEDFQALGDHGFASLAIELPTRGVEYRFVTPRGELEITAQAVDQKLLRAVWGVGITLAVLLGIWLLFRVCVRLSRIDPLIAPVGVMLGGAVCFLLQVLPLGGILILIMGTAWLVKTLWTRRTPAPTAATA